MAGAVKTLQFSEGTAVSAPTAPSIRTFSGQVSAGSVIFPSGGNDALSHYEDNEITSGVTWSGATSNPATYAFTMTRVGRLVTVSFQFAEATMGNNSLQATGVIPSNFRPSANMVFVTTMRINGSNTATAIEMQSDGDVIIHKSTALAVFATTDTVTTVSGNRYVGMSYYK